MMYQVVFADKALKELKKMDKSISRLILKWVQKNLESCENPRKHGKALVGNHAGSWRYRVGDYRLIADIQDDKIVIMILSVGHRKNIY